jgi:hypothetical protein
VDLMEDNTVTDSRDETVDGPEPTGLAGTGTAPGAPKSRASRGGSKAPAASGKKGTAPKPAGTRSARGSSKKGAGVKGQARKPATNRTTKGAVKAGATSKPMKPVALKGKGKKAARRR